MSSNGKGEAVLAWEAVADEAKQRALEYRKTTQEAVGAVPARAVRMTPDQKAQAYLPDFYARGMATGPVGLAYWTQLLQERGPKGAFKEFGQEMVRLMDSPKHWATPITGASPAQQRQTTLLRQQGSHASAGTGGTDGAAPY